MNIFLHELKANLKSLIVWSVIIGLFILVGFSKFTAYYENPELAAILDDIPPSLLDAFSLSSFNLTTLPGFVGIMFIYNALLLSIAAVMWGSDIITKEEREKTVEFALTLPVKRQTLVTAKAATALVNCIALNLVTWGITLAVAQRYQPDAEFNRYLTLSMAAVFTMQIVFLAIGLLLGCALKQYKRANAIAVSILLGTYFLSVVISLNKDLDFLKYFSPFKYFDAATLLREMRLEFGYIALSIGIAVVCIVGAYIAYQRRDLYI